MSKSVDLDFKIKNISWVIYNLLEFNNFICNNLWVVRWLKRQKIHTISIVKLLISHKKTSKY